MFQADKIAQAIRDLGYDFNHFVLMDFVHYVAAQRSKPIIVQDFPLSRDLFGAWIAKPDVDYIMVNDRTHIIHRAHIILHEIAHMVLKHPPRPLSELLPPQLLRALEQAVVDGHARCIRTNALTHVPEEQEAEEFVFQIRDHVSRANRLIELIEIGTSIPSLHTLFVSQDDEG